MCVGDWTPVPLGVLGRTSGAESVFFFERTAHAGVRESKLRGTACYLRPVKWMTLLPGMAARQMNTSRKFLSQPSE